MRRGIGISLQGRPGGQGNVVLLRPYAEGWQRCRRFGVTALCTDSRFNQDLEKDR